VGHRNSARVLCNGIGASLEVLDPVVAELDPHTTVVRFDVPGSGASPDSPLPYRFPYLACVLGNLLKKVGVLAGERGSLQVDVLGLSWGGALVQQFAFQNPRRCRRLILVSTGTGPIMIPANRRCSPKCLHRGGFWTIDMRRWWPPSSTVGRPGAIRWLATPRCRACSVRLEAVFRTESVDGLLELFADVVEAIRF
jgi:pimeloyl-ACP methyl ester carboxylesterase